MTATKHTNEDRLRLSLAILAALAILIAGCGSDDTEAAATSLAPAPTATTVTTTTVAATTTMITEAPVDTAAVRALLDEFYAAYNAGDADTANSMFSSLIRETTPGNLRYWSGTLGEQIEAACVAGDDGGIACSETYTDALHGPAGLTARSRFIYYERNGKLQQAADPGWNGGMMPGCLERRCPGGDIRQSADEGVTWDYDRLEADLFAWLEETYPEVAAEIGDAKRLNYFSGNAAAAEAAIPYIEEFLAQSEEWGGSGSGGADFSGLTVMEAVEGMYAALNSRDPVVFESFFGGPPDGPMEWFWAMGTRWEYECEATAEPGRIRCVDERIDEFYTKAGAVFETTTEWIVEEDELFDFAVSERSSGHWAFHGFEQAFLDWLETAYPEEHAIADSGEFTHSGEAGAIGAARIDEFLEWSDEYPREADPTNQD